MDLVFILRIGDMEATIKPMQVRPKEISTPIDPAELRIMQKLAGKDAQKTDEEAAEERLFWSS